MHNISQQTEYIAAMQIDSKQHFQMQFHELKRFYDLQLASEKCNIVLCATFIQNHCIVQCTDIIYHVFIYNPLTFIEITKRQFSVSSWLYSQFKTV